MKYLSKSPVRRASQHLFNSGFAFKVSFLEMQGCQVKEKIGRDAWSNFRHMGFLKITNIINNIIKKPMLETKVSFAITGKTAHHLPIFSYYWEEERKVSFFCNGKNHTGQK